MRKNYWLFNTDRTEQEGEGAFREMIDQRRIAAWGYCRGGARRTLNKPRDGETVYFFRAGHGIIACGQASGEAFGANSVFDQDGEYHRSVTNLRVLPSPLTVAEVRENTEYNLPCRHIVCRLRSENGVRFLQEQFENVPGF